MVSSFVKTQAVIQTEFQAAPIALTNKLRAFLVGPLAGLHRHSVAGEKANISLGEYDPNADTTYDWPNRNADSLIDQDYAKVFIDNALLRYFQDLISAGSAVAPVSGKPNRIRSEVTSFKDNGDDYPRSASLYDRDVKVGDTVYVRGVSGSTAYDLWTYVKGFVGDPVAAITGDAAADAANQAAQTLATSVDKIGGVDNCVTLTLDMTEYDGLPSGDVEETYTVEVTASSIGGDLTTATLRVTSASGNDDVASVTPEAAGTLTAIGTRGLRVEFNILAGSSCSSAANNDSVSSDDLITGQKWRIHVLQDFTPSTFESSGTYTGDTDTTYLIEVTKGGLFDDNPQITCTTTTGVDTSGPTTVAASGTAVAVGSYGVRIAFTGTGLRKGDRYTIEATAEAEGAMRTLILGHDLPSSIRSVSDLDLKLFIKKDIQVSKNRTGYAPETNWSTDEDGITVNSGILAYDTTWTDDGTELALPVVGGTVYAEYREWLDTLAGSVHSLGESSDVATFVGTVHPDNPLAYGLYKALKNSHGCRVRYTAVTDPDSTDAWQTALDLAKGRDDAYNVVPLTMSQTIQDLFVAHVNSESSVENGRWRGTFLAAQVASAEAVVNDGTSSDGEVVLATLENDDDASVQPSYSILRLSTTNAELISLGVVAGDVVRFGFTTDGFGSSSYTEYVIDEVLSESAVKLKTAGSVPVSTAQKVEIWHTLSTADMVTKLTDRATGYSNERVCLVWPDVVGDNGTNVDGYFFCAALAGLRSGSLPHQPLTNVEVADFDDLSRSYSLFSASQLNALAAAGVWVGSDDDGTAYTRQAVTTDISDIDHHEEMVRANVDAISLYLTEYLKPFVGSSNVVRQLLTSMRVQIEAAIEYLKTAVTTDTLGPMVVDAAVSQVRQHSTLKDRTVVIINLTVPYTHNQIQFTLVI